MAEELRKTAPELFEKALVDRVQVVGPDFAPASAAEFVEILIRTVQPNMVIA
ncbi:hypothetical protein KIP88_41915 [Bradyrhizobium sp. SRL28]|uniref:hypothetical protein n=1 Tax=Bradyrhizobium sp. SRL28 TaxID=2836178 RepID=UPI001BDDE04E|nr:hypothetical protein [Bradyrhizobium sp. SRL28]MBT1516951.1 hypothetical protein [Bradyrhizobium sp. SRL28]